MNNKLLAAVALSLMLCLSAAFTTNMKKFKLSSQKQQTNNTSSMNLAETVEKLIVARTQIERLNILNKNTDFVYDFLNPIPGTTEISGKGGEIIGANRDNFPAVVGTGMSMNYAFVEPCGLNTPHIHPRASELFYAINGTFETGFIAENGARIVNNTVHSGQVTVFPQGSMHYQANLGCESASFIAAFSNEDPGISLIAQNFFRIPEKILSPTLGGVSDDELKFLLDNIPSDLAHGLKSCRKRCGLDDSSSAN